MIGVRPILVSIVALALAGLGLACGDPSTAADPGVARDPSNDPPAGGFPLPTTPGASIPRFAWLDVVTVTTGESLDHDGYVATVAGVSAPVPTVGTRSFDVDKGEVTVNLSGVASNCRVDDGAERQVSVSSGPYTNPITFHLTCAEDPGEPAGGRIALDVGGAVWYHAYTVTLDGSRTLTIDRSGTFEFTDVPDGDHVLGIPDFVFGGPIACDLERQGAGPIAVAGGETARVPLSFECY